MRLTAVRKDCAITCAVKAFTPKLWCDPEYDHLRNRGYQRDPAGWRLAPAYELNPMPVDVKPRHHALTLNETDDASSMDTASSNRLGVDGVKNRPARRR
ncbi:hypothetical protein CDQ92_10470 [Sphingopyxis bauzanensis]|uniref:Uncharacterized protein n=1 Tax=Sphingopyxis bauzanensis TaxID=651663 RepID=A0A246JWJ0_9SPHN|nr:hypothetical protein CDQ92_10470 [Sphingopyxis bauzanensis]